MELTSSTAGHKRHFAVTGYVVNPERTKLLMIHHNKLNKWLPPGGHLEPNELPHEGALRETLEETGVHARCVSNDDPELGLANVSDTQVPRPFAVLYEVIPASSKDVEHIHIDMLFMLEADDDVPINAQLEEVAAVQWRTRADILRANDVFDSVKGFAKLYLVTA
ncbi:MAG TPA: NUDIX domain-containing protein [Candidatus Saccharimonadales bacterium]